MNTKLFTILTTSMLLGTAGFAAASTVFGSPSEQDPYCELTRNGAPQNYPGIGWYPEIIKTDQPIGATGATLTVCEGEHWDGQDSVMPTHANSGDCTGQTPDLDNDAYNVAFRQCSDPGRMPVFDIFNPLGLRVSAMGDKATLDRGAAYAFVRINGAGTVGIFASGCHKLGDGSSQMFGFHDGAHNCQSGGNGLGHGVAAVYLQDDTPAGLNILAGVVSALRLTKGYASEGDCSQSGYNQSALAVAAQQDPTCGRDNTAITIELLA